MLFISYFEIFIVSDVSYVNFYVVGPQHAAIKLGYKEPSALIRTILADHDKVYKASSPVIHTDNGIAFQDDCVVSSWSKWSKCSKSCGENSFKFRTRTCNCNYKKLCKPSTLQREHCKLKKCEGKKNILFICN